MRFRPFGSNIPLLLDSQQTAQVLNVSMGRVQRWARAGRLRSYHAGRRLRFLEEDIRAFVGLPPENGASGPSPACPNTVPGGPDPFEKALTDLERRLAGDLERTVCENQPPGVPTRWQVDQKTVKQARADLRRALSGGKLLR